MLKKRGRPESANRLITTKLEGRAAVLQAVYFLAFAVVGVPLCIRVDANQAASC